MTQITATRLPHGRKWVRRNRLRPLSMKSYRGRDNCNFSIRRLGQAFKMAASRQRSRCQGRASRSCESPGNEFRSWLRSDTLRSRLRPTHLCHRAAYPYNVVENVDDTFVACLRRATIGTWRSRLEGGDDCSFNVLRVAQARGTCERRSAPRLRLCHRTSLRPDSRCQTTTVLLLPSGTPC